MSDRWKAGILKLIFLSVICLSLYLIFGEEEEKKTESPKKTVPVIDVTTIEERIRERNLDIQLERDIRTQQVLSEKFNNSPVGFIDPLEPKINPLDMDLSFPEDQSIQSTFRDLNNENLGENAYEDPENTIRRQLDYYDWFNKYLKDKNERQKKQFIQYFVRTVNEQGYDVSFKKDGKVIVTPKEKKKKEKPLEKLKVNWK